MNRKEFRLLLKRYLKGTCTDEEKAWVDHWYDLLHDHQLKEISASEFDALEKEIWANIQEKAQFSSIPLTQRAPIRHRFIRRYAAVAAVLIGLVAGVAWFFPLAEPASACYEKMIAKKGYQETVNQTNQIKKLQLEDGSLVSLHPGSKLAFPAHFNPEKREVYLEGAAFFEVSKRPGQPFFVYNGRLVTQVLGTSFEVKVDRESKEVVVAVTSGKVAVYENKRRTIQEKDAKKNNGVIITPNQKVTYKTDSRLFETSLVDAPLPIHSTDNIKAPAVSFAFDEARLTTVLSSMENAYGIEIIAENEKLYNCAFTGDITSQPLYNKLELVCQSIDATYEIKGTRILLKGKGCAP